MLTGLVLCALLQGACGKYGKPMRHDPRDPEPEKRYTLAQAGEER